MLLFSEDLNAQRLSDLISEEVCQCLSGEPRPVARTALESCFKDIAIPYTIALPVHEAKVHEIVQDVLMLLKANCNLAGDQHLQLKASYNISDNPEAVYFYEPGNKALSKGKYKCAIQFYKKALKIDPTFVMAMDRMAVAHRQLGEYNEAIKWYEQSRSVKPEGHFAIINLADIYSVRVEKKKAVALYQELIDRYPDNPEGYFGISKVLMIQENFAQALPVAVQAHKLYARQGNPHLRESNLLISRIFVEMEKRGEENTFLDVISEAGIDIHLVEEQQ
jgi:tetratricopeptide (TPR) repeat protein